MPESTARELASTGRRLAELPELTAVFAADEIVWSKVRRIALVATPETEKAWIERAGGTTCDELSRLVSSVSRGDAPPKPGEGLPRTKFKKQLVLDPVQRDMFEHAHEKLERDDHRCRCCRSRRSPMLHHVLWRSRGGPTIDDNLVTLCARCHGLVHDEYLFASGTGRRGFGSTTARAAISTSHCADGHPAPPRSCAWSCRRQLEPLQPAQLRGARPPARPRRPSPT